MLKFWRSVVMLIFSFTSVFSQDNVKELSIPDFDKLNMNQLPISKGVIFRPIDSKTYAGSSFFGEKERYIGDVFYQGEWYKELNLAYDLYSDQLIHIKPTGEWIVLVKPEVESFTLGSRNFVNNPFVYEQGPSFFEVILPGKAVMLAKHSLKAGNYDVKILRRPLEHRTKFIVQALNSYNEVENKGDLLKALKGKRSEISMFIKTQKLDFKNNFEESVKQVLTYYNQLN